MRKSYRVHVGLNGVYNGDDEFMAGESIMFSGPANKIPAGYLIEDGSAVGRVAYATLFAAIGTTYGAGDGATTFNVPDSRAQVWRGLDMGRGVDPGRVHGSAQKDAMQRLRGQVSSMSPPFRGATYSGVLKKREGSDGPRYEGGASDGTDIEFDNAADPNVRTANENRMCNLAKIPLIKY